MWHVNLGVSEGLLIIAINNLKYVVQSYCVFIMVVTGSGPGIGTGAMASMILCRIFPLHLNMFWNLFAYLFSGPEVVSSGCFMGQTGPR